MFTNKRQRAPPARQRDVAAMRHALARGERRAARRLQGAAPMSAVLKQAAPRITAMTEAALGTVVRIENAIYEFPWTLGNFRDSLAAGYGCWLYEESDALIGYAVVMHALDEAHLLNLSIARAAQRRGHGLRLLAEISRAARGHGAKSMLLEVRPGNLAGRALYAAAGFSQVGLRRAYYPAHGGREDALVLSRTL